MARLIELDELMKYPIRLNHYDKKNGNIHFVYGVESVLEYAEYMPKVDAVEVKKARWKGEGFGEYSCSLCGEIVTGNEYNYCPNCGAYMKGD